MGKFSLEEVKEMARLAINAMEDKKAEDIRVIDISQVSVLADYFIIEPDTDSFGCRGRKTREGRISCKAN